MVSSTGPTILYGGNVVYKSTNDGSTWSSAPTSYSSGDVSALAVAPSNSSVIYAGFDDGTLQMSRDSGTTWNTLTTPAAGEFITHITVSSTNPDTVYISYGSDFPSFGLNPKILVGTSLGTTPNWTDVTGNLPAGVDSNSVISNGSAGLIVASDAGVFTAPVLNGSSTSWTEVGSNLPNVQVMDLLLNSSGTLIATTHGRGIWTFPFSVTTSPPTTSVLVPAKGATLSGTAATLDASASNATSVEFWILGRLLRLHRQDDRHGYSHPLRMGNPAGTPRRSPTPRTLWSPKRSTTVVAPSAPVSTSLSIEPAVDERARPCQGGDAVGHSCHLGRLRLQRHQRGVLDTRRLLRLHREDDRHGHAHPLRMGQ